MGGAAETDPGEPLHLALAGYEHEWPADFEAFVARELIPLMRAQGAGEGRCRPRGRLAHEPGHAPRLIDADPFALQLRETRDSRVSRVALPTSAFSFACVCLKSATWRALTRMGSFSGMPASRSAK